MWPPQRVNTWLTPASLSVRATSSPPVIQAEEATPSEPPRRSLQTRLAARAAGPPRPPLGSHGHSPEFLPFDGFAVEAPGDEGVADLVDHRLAPRDIGDEPGHAGDQGPDCLGEAARPVPCRAPGARHHRAAHEPGIPASA